MVRADQEAADVCIALGRRLKAPQLLPGRNGEALAESKGLIRLLTFYQAHQLFENGASGVRVLLLAETGLESPRKNNHTQVGQL